ncbi:MAG: hypothetical protein RO469_11360 [Thermincola sp.]|nr:hypothetical protein [Thermincola sp.]
MLPLWAGTDSSNFPTTEGAFDQTHNGGTDVFYSRLNNKLGSLLHSTFIGGSGSDSGYSAYLDDDGFVYLTGYTSSSNFPVTSGAYRTTTHYGGAFLTKAAREISGLDAVEYMYLLDLDDFVEPGMGSHTMDHELLEVTGAQPLSFNIRNNSLLLKEGPMGIGWGHNFETGLVFLENGNINVSWNANSVNGFVYKDGTEFTPANLANRFDTLVKDQNGQYILTRYDQTTYIFNSTGQLVEQKNKNGQSLSMSYDTSNRLSTITEPISERHLSITYNANGLIDKVQVSLPELFVSAIPAASDS